jgi:hypothetical protein
MVYSIIARCSNYIAMKLIFAINQPTLFLTSKLNTQNNLQSKFKNFVSKFNIMFEQITQTIQTRLFWSRLPFSEKGYVLNQSYHLFVIILLPLEQVKVPSLVLTN